MCRLISGIVLLLCLHGTASAASMKVQAVATDLNLNQVDHVYVHQQFSVVVFAQDLRGLPPANSGVFSAGARILYDETKATADASQTVKFSDFFSLTTISSFTPGVIQAHAAAGTLQAPGSAPQFLFQAMMLASNPGSLALALASSAQGDNQYELYSKDDAVNESEIEFIITSLDVLASYASIADAVAHETDGATTMQFAVTLTEALPFSVSIPFSTFDGTADRDDYQSLSGFVTFAPGETLRYIDISILGDLDVELDEALSVRIGESTPIEGLFIDRSLATGRILNDDHPVPEPSTWLLATFGALGLLMARRRIGVGN